MLVIIGRGAAYPLEVGVALCPKSLQPVAVALAQGVVRARDIEMRFKWKISIDLLLAGLLPMAIVMKIDIVKPIPASVPAPRI